MSKTFTIDARNNAGKQGLNVTAESHGEAARKAAKRWFGPQAVAQRTSGESDKGGMFQSYVTNGAGQLNSVGSSFHVYED